MKLEITFKSGAQVLIDCTQFKTGRNPISGDLASLEWETPADWSRKLHLAELSEIVCLVAVEPTDPEAAQALRDVLIELDDVDPDDIRTWLAERVERLERGVDL